MRTARPTWLQAALSAAAVLVVALVAFVLLRPDDDSPAAGPTGPSPSVSSSAASTDSPSARPSLSPRAPTAGAPVGSIGPKTPPVPAPTSTRPASVPEGSPAGSPGPVPTVTRQGRGDPLFDSCEQAVEAGFGPYTQGIHPEYDSYDDPDGDGTACPSEP